MAGKNRMFVRPDTGERREFAPDDYQSDFTTQWSKVQESEPVTCFRASDGYRIDPRADGRYEDREGKIWQLEKIA
jgi:hypothetical protein